MPKKNRVKIPQEIADKVMFIHNSTCCVCKEPNKETQIHHIDDNPANNAINNLAVLCLECHNKTQITGGFGRRLNAGQVTLYRDEWIQIVKERKRNLTLLSISADQNNMGSWEKINFTNQCGIELAIAGLGLNQNNVESCPKLPIFVEAYKSLDNLNFVNIIGESGSGKSLTAFQIAYEYFKNGYTVYSYTGGEVTNILDNSPSLYIVDNAHLHKSIVDTFKNKVNKNVKLICVYTDSADTKESGIRITAKQAVGVLYDYYKKNAQQIIPIVKKFNRKLGVEIGDATYSDLLERARREKNPYYFNFIIRGAADYIKDKIADYKAENFGDILAIIAIFQILNADDFLTIDEINKLLDTRTIPDDFENKLIVNDKILIANRNAYKFSHIHTAINYLIYYLLNSFDNQTFANKIFWHIFNANSYSLLGLLWLINNTSHLAIKYKTKRCICCLFSVSEIETIYDKLHDRKHEPYFLSIIERIDHYLQNRNTDDKIDEYIEIINSCQLIDLPSAGNYINMQINKGKDNEYILLKKIQNSINFSRILKLFNDASSDNLIYFVRFFDRVAYNFKGWHKKISSYLNIDEFVLKINNAQIDNLYAIADLVATFYSLDTSLISIRDACSNRILFYLKQNPLEAWQHIDDKALFVLFGYHKFTNKKIKNSAYYKLIRAKFADAISPKLLSNQIESNILVHWQTIAELLETVFIFDRNKYPQIINGIDLKKLSMNLKGLWNTGQEFEFLRVFYYDKKTLRDLIIISELDIEQITTSILFFSTDGALYLYKAGKSFNLSYARNDYILIGGLISLLKKNKSLGIDLIIKTKDQLIKFIQGTIYDYDDSEKKLKEFLYKSLKDIEHDLSTSGLTQLELDILTNLENYNFVRKT